jgi:Mu transposase-like protein
MLQDAQVRKLFCLLSKGDSLQLASLKTGMDEKTARKYRKAERMPSELSARHDWRTRIDPFLAVWDQVEKQLQENPGLQAKSLFAWLQGEHPGQFQDGQLRTFQRGVHRWRATRGPDKEVFFSQVHEPGRLCASDFTHMTSLEVTMMGQSFDHMVFHFVLTYSNWEWANVCFSESFESLSEGLQGAVWALGGVPVRHRTDRLSAAVNNLSETKEFTSRYQGLMDHYGLEKERIQARQAHENGDVESSHRHFKEAVDQALMLRGSRDFECRDEYSKFLTELLRQRNLGREIRTQSERVLLRALPARRCESWRRVRVRVGLGSTLKVDRNTYSVPSRLIGESVDVRLCVEDLEVWYGGTLMERIPRLRGRGQERINYRHVIGWLVRKPGAFERYRYREGLFPTSRFRMAYDALTEHLPTRAVREYLGIVELAALEGEALVDDALRILLDGEAELTARAVEQFVRSASVVPEVTAVQVAEVDLSCFDQLLEDREVWSGDSQGSERDVAGSVAGAAFACVP